MDDKRVRGTIERVFTGWVFVSFGGCGQGFGGLVLDESTGRAFEEELRRLFPGKIEGQTCYLLFCRSRYSGDRIEGLENERGERFTITGFRRKHWPDKARSAFEEQRESIEREIAWAERRAKEARTNLAKLKSEWTEWEDEPLREAPHG